MHQDKKELVIKGLLKNKVVAYHPDLAIMIDKLTNSYNSVSATVFLSQLIYWESAEADEEGWFTKNAEEIYERTGLRRKAQEGARQLLKKLGILEEKNAGMPRRVYYKINWGRLIAYLEEYFDLKEVDMKGKG